MCVCSCVLATPNDVVVAVIFRCVCVFARVFVQAEAERAKARRLDEARRAVEAAVKVSHGFVLPCVTFGN